MADNIIGNGALRTPVISGSLFLTYTDLYLLTDQGTSSSGISLTGQTVYIEADLSNRLNINDIRIYLTSATSSGTILGNLNFAYKNYEGDNYIYLDKNYNTQYFYADNLTQEFSPRYIRFDITSTTCELLEFEIYANDDIVNFGSDGLQTEYIISDTPTDDYNIIQIYNNHATIVANAYAAVDYTGEASDGYIELYDPQTNTFYNINDGVILKDNVSSSNYRWDHGIYTYTEVRNNKVVLSDVKEGFIFNPDNIDTNLIISNYGLTLENSGVDTWGAGKTYSSLNHGKFYFEVKIDNIGAVSKIMVGLGTTDASIANYPGYDSYSAGYYSYNGNKYFNATAASFGNTYTVNDIIGVAINTNNGKVWFSKNGVWQASGDPENDLNSAFTKTAFINSAIYPMVGLYSLSSIVTLRIEPSTLSYSPPNGFTSLVDTVYTTGYYTTPIFSFENQYATSYITTDSTTNSGINNIGTNINFGTIEVRSSDIEPIQIDEIYWLCTPNAPSSYSPNIYFDRYTVYTDNEETNWTTSKSHPSDTYTTMFSAAANTRNGYVIHNWLYNRYGTLYSYFRVVDRVTGEDIYYDKINSGDYRFDGGMEYNYFDSVWCYSTIKGILALLDYSSGSMVIVYETNLGYDYIGDFSAEPAGAGVWYTDKASENLVHKDGSGNTLLEDTSMTTPRAVCATSDNGCWVVDNYNYALRRYNFDGEIIITGNLNRTATKMINDGEDGFFYISGDYVYHVLNTGQSGISVVLDSPTDIMNGNDIFAVYSSTNHTITVIDKSSGAILKTINQRYNYNGIPALYSMNQEKHSESYTNVLPLSYDPIWGVSGTLDWYMVKRNEYILPKKRYHQVKTTLTTTDYTNSPSVNGIATPPAVKIQDIQPQDSKPLYIRTNFEEGANMQDYITNLRVWWEI